MEVVSSRNVVSSETEITITAYNFQHDYAMRAKYEYKAKNIQI